MAKSQLIRFPAQKRRKNDSLEAILADLEHLLELSRALRKRLNKLIKDAA